MQALIVIERINLHGHLADLVSKAPYLCFYQFSGKNECSVCLHPRERVQQRRRSIHIYPYKNQEPPCWTHAQTLLHIWNQTLFCFEILAREVISLEFDNSFSLHWFIFKHVLLLLYRTQGQNKGLQNQSYSWPGILAWRILRFSLSGYTEDDDPQKLISMV